MLPTSYLQPPILTRTCLAEGETSKFARLLRKQDSTVLPPPITSIKLNDFNKSVVLQTDDQVF